jgi:DNA-binding MarR family transcriptional regulator
MPSTTGPSTTGPSTTDPVLASALRLSVMRLARRLRSQRAETDLTLTQLSVLATLDRHGPLTPRELAVHEKVQPPSMTRVVASVEDHGLVARTPHPTDKRQVLVALTAAGTRLLAEDRRRRDAWLARRVGELSAEDRAVLHAATPILDRLART